MARFKITAPDGGTYEITAPDGATEQDALAHLQKTLAGSGGMDFNRPHEAVRADIAKLQGPQRDKAMRAWADHVVKQENEKGGIGQDIDNTVRTLARGTFAGPFLDEVNAAGAAVANTLGLGGSTYDEALAYQRARDRYVDQKHPVLSPAGQIAGGIAGMVAAPGIGGAGPVAQVARMVVGGPFANIRPAQTVLGRVGQVAGVGGVYGGVSGFGNAEGGAANRAEGTAIGTGIGVLTGGGLGVGGETVRQIGRARAGLGRNGAYGSIADDIEGGAARLADQVAVGGNRTANQATNRLTLDILGEEMQRAGGDAQSAIRATIDRLVNQHALTNAEAAARIQELQRVHRGSNLMLGEYPSVAASDAAHQQWRGLPHDQVLGDVGRVQNTTTQATLDYLANNGNAQSAQNVRNAVAARQERMGPAMADTLERLAPQIQQDGTGPIWAARVQDAQQLIQQARNLGGAEYRAAYRQGNTDNRRLITTLPRLLDRFDNAAAGRAGEYAAAIRQASGQFYIETPNGRVAMQTLQQMQDARAAVRGQMQGYIRVGRDDLARVVQPVYDQITRLMRNANPQWGRANDRWADMRLQEVGQELGDAFSMKAGPRFREQLAEFNRLAPEAQNIVRIHFLEQLHDKLANLGDNHSVSKLFTNDHARNMIATLFGRDAAVEFTRAVRDQKAVEVTQAMMSNSATHRRGVAQQQKDGATGLVSAVENASPSGIRGWVMDMAKRALTENRNRPMSEILTTPMSDMPRVAQHIHNMRTQEGRLARVSQPTMRPIRAAGAIATTEGDLANRPRK